MAQNQQCNERSCLLFIFNTSTQKNILTRRTIAP